MLLVLCPKSSGFAPWRAEWLAGLGSWRGCRDDMFDDFAVGELHIGACRVDEEFGREVSRELVAGLTDSENPASLLAGAGMVV